LKDQWPVDALGKLQAAVAFTTKLVDDFVMDTGSISTILGTNGLNSADVPLSNKQTNNYGH